MFFVLAIVVTERDTGRARGFGFVTFEKEEDARAAIDGLNETVCTNITEVSNKGVTFQPGIILSWICFHFLEL